MAGFFCAVILIGVLNQIEGSASSALRSLYERAAELIAAGQVDASIDLLEEIVCQHAQSPVAEVAAVHLAECYLIDKRYSDAQVVLGTWRARLDRSPTADKLSPGLVHKARSLSCRAARELAIEALGRADTTQALERLEQAAEFASVDELPEIETEKLRIRTLQLRDALLQGQDLESLLGATPASEQVVLRFALAEQLHASSQFELSQQQLRWLEAYALRDADAKAEWGVTVDLRLAESLVATSDYPAALKRLQNAKLRYADAACVHDINFLIARCAVAQVKFDLALEHLQSITQAQPMAEVAARARAHWLSGEIALLQHDYPRAIAAYDQAIQLDAAEWQSRALIQKARCQEVAPALGDCRLSYQQAVDRFGGTQASRIAALRLTKLNSTSALRIPDRNVE